MQNQNLIACILFGVTAGSASGYGQFCVDHRNPRFGFAGAIGIALAMIGLLVTYVTIVSSVSDGRGMIIFVLTHFYINKLVVDRLYGRDLKATLDKARDHLDLLMSHYGVLNESQDESPNDTDN